MYQLQSLPLTSLTQGYNQHMHLWCLHVTGTFTVFTCTSYNPYLKQVLYKAIITTFIYIVKMYQLRTQP